MRRRMKAAVFAERSEAFGHRERRRNVNGGNACTPVPDCRGSVACGIIRPTFAYESRWKFNHREWSAMLSEVLRRRPVSEDYLPVFLTG